MRKPIQSLRLILGASVVGTALVLTSLSASAQESAPSASPQQATRVDQLGLNPWAQFPTVEFPERASARLVSYGRVILLCRFEPTGFLTQCQIAEESPAGMGFGLASLAGARRGARLNQQTLDRLPSDSVVAFSITFRLPPDLPSETPVPASSMDLPSPATPL
jgi:hypothetical protein